MGGTLSTTQASSVTPSSRGLGSGAAMRYLPPRDLNTKLQGQQKPQIMPGAVRASDMKRKPFWETREMLSCVVFDVIREDG